jgi:CDGSH-type Zn-finger protein
MSGGHETATGATSAAGQGRLAQLIAARGGRAEPEAPFVIEHREALIYMLCEAAELEHGIMCQYLFAAFSLKQGEDEGLSAAQVDAVRHWRGVVAHVATQEMLHLALVHNLLSAVGAAPHLARPNLPQPLDHYPARVQLALLPFGEEALRHFMFLERPEGMELEDAEGLTAMGRAEPVLEKGDIVPRLQDFATVGHLYRSIEQGLAHLADKYGEEWLFVGPPEAQATTANFRWPELVAVTDLESAQQAVDTILEQGEGPRGEWRTAHFGQFVDVLDEYEQTTEANPGFEPVRPVLAANCRQPERRVDVPLITDVLTAKCTDLFNVGYEILLQIFERYFAHTEETDAQLATLADATMALMFQVIKPLGELITTLPVGPGFDGKTAGPSFELFYESDYLMPHRAAAWALLAERLDEAAHLSGEIASDAGGRVAESLAPVGSALSDTAQSLKAHFSDWGARPRPALDGAPAGEGGGEELESLGARAAELSQAVGGATVGEDGRELAMLFDRANRLATAVVGGDSDLLPGQARPVAARLVDSVLRPLAGVLALTPTGRPGAAPDGHVARKGSVKEEVWHLAKEATRSCTHLGLASAARPGLLEATAALQDLACRLEPDDRNARTAELRSLQTSMAPAIQPAPDGPYLVINAENLRSWLGEALPACPAMALCRCGGSAIKPLCDGTHATIGFTAAKDPKRVADRRATYVGQQVTILDNRGTCQHSGLCSDRLSTVFRTDQEPFVAPSGGRMDEIIRAVRDCPSGALSYALDGEEASDQVDWDNRREPTIEVSKDGPYRITGGVALVSEEGGDVARNAGASYEHYALCRCGHSQNKPFCSGMHWYVDFHDPVLEPDREPTMFEWCGGLPALTRMTRVFYERYVPEDPLLAPLFANMSADHPQRVAKWLGEVFGGPSAYSDNYGGYSRMVHQHIGKGLTEERRARWVALILRSADEAGLPSDPEFRSAFASYIEWGSRLALENSQAGAKPPEHMPMPHWGWGTAGPPGSRVPAMPSAGEGDEQPVVLPAADETVSFAKHIKPLFRQRDRQSMKFAFDLWSYEDVGTRADDILERLRNGSMPCDGSWPEEKVQAFQRWIGTGKTA